MNVKKAVGITDYNAYVEKKAPKTKLFSTCVRAFLAGGAICVLGELLNSAAKDLILLDEEQAGMFTSMCLIFLGALFTGLGVYDVLGRFAGAGSIVPITGFANSIVAPAVDFKAGGLYFGCRCKDVSRCPGRCWCMELCRRVRWVSSTGSLQCWAVENHWGQTGVANVGRRWICGG